MSLRAPPNNWMRRARLEDGTLVLVVVFLVALLAMGALSVDVGNAQLQRKKIHEGTDAAALAAVGDWWITKDKTIVDSVARAFAQTNGVKAAEIISVKAGKWLTNGNTFVELDTLVDGVVPAVQVIATRRVDMAFARVVGFAEMNPRVESVAIVGKPISTGCVLPWAACSSFVGAKCDPITLQMKDGGETNACSVSGSLQGNFGQLTLPGNSGASWYRQNIAQCYQGTLSVGQCVDTDPGVSWGPTKQGIGDRIGNGQNGTAPTYDCALPAPAGNPRTAIIPRVDSLDVSGKKQVCITGFYTVRLDGYDNSAKTVNATFIELIGDGVVNPSEPPTSGELAVLGLVK